MVIQSSLIIYDLNERLCLKIFSVVIVKCCKKVIFLFYPSKITNTFLTCSKSSWEYFNKIRPYLRNMIDNNKAKGEWKI